MSHEATETADVLDEMCAQTILGDTDLADNIEAAIEEVVEDGSFVTDTDVTVTKPLTARERLTGRAELNMTAVFAAGLMLGARLERDVPMGSTEEDAWRRGEFAFPYRND